MSRSGLTPLDATFLELEEQDAAAHMHIGSIMVFEPHKGTPPTLRRLRRHVERRLALLPRYTCRLSEPHTRALHWPGWEPDPGFRVEEHVSGERLGEPGSERELLDWAAAYWAKRLDRRRPLWDLRLLTGLADGRWAIATKTHHALVDGVGSADVATVLLDTVRTPRRAGAAAPEPAPEPDVGPLERLAGGLRGGLYAARHPGRLRDAFLEAKAMAEILIRDEVIAAPHSSLNVPLGPDRRYRVVRADLTELKAIKRALGGTVNDVVLAAVTGGLREVLEARGEPLPDQGLRAMVPVNLRAAAERLELGNRVSSLFVHLPVAEPDPLGRFRKLAEEAARLKASGQAAGGAELIAIGGIAPPILHALLARSVFATRLFNITITNVPGPRAPLFAFGARMEEVLPLVPLAADHSLGVAVVSYDGRVFFGLVGDGRSGAALEVLARGVERALADLARLTAPEALPALG